MSENNVPNNILSTSHLKPGQMGMQVVDDDGTKKIVPLKKSTICLSMIVKNESHIIERCFDSIRKYIDYWVITDTGSTDNTPKIIEAYFKKHKIKGELHHVSWQNFGYNRTKLMELSRNKADYCILMDADFVFNCRDEDFKMKLYYDCYLINYDGKLDYCQVLFVKSCYKWEYIGVTHEYIKCTDPSPKEKILTAKMPFFTFNHVGDGGCKSDKYERDVRLLLKGLEDEPDNVRYHFYLAQSYKDLKDYKKGIEWYQKRVELGGWQEEVYYSMLQVGFCQLMSEMPFKDFGGQLLETYHYRPIRLEALYLFVAYCRNEKKYLLGFSMGRPACDNPYPEKDVLFIDRTIHEYRLIEEVGICAFFIGKYLDCLILNKKLQKGPNQDPEFQKKVELRLKLCNEKLDLLKTRNITNSDIHPTVVQHALNEKDRAEKAQKETISENSSENQRQGQALEEAKRGNILQVEGDNLHNLTSITSENDFNKISSGNNINLVNSTHQTSEVAQDVTPKRQEIRIELDQDQLEIIKQNQLKVGQIVPNQPQILIIGNFISFNMNNGIDNNRIKFFRYLSHEKNNIIIQGTRPIDFFNQNVNMPELIKNIYGPHNKPDLIIYYLMGTTDLSMRFLFQGLENVNIKKMVWIEDIQYLQYYHPFITQLNFNSVLLSYRNSKVKSSYQSILGNSYLVGDMEQSIDTKIFKDYQLEKKYDILFFGYHDPKIYKFRDRLYHLLKKLASQDDKNTQDNQDNQNNQDNQLKIKFIEHPGYNNIKTVTNSKTNIVGEDLAKLINQSYLVICTKSNYDVLLKKYLEVGCCNSIICGDLPPDYLTWKDEIDMVYLNDEMSEEDIIKTIQESLNDKESLLSQAKKNLDFFHTRSSYQTGYQNFIENINSMLYKKSNIVEKIVKTAVNIKSDVKTSYTKGSDVKTSDIKTSVTEQSVTEQSDTEPSDVETSDMKTYEVKAYEVKTTDVKTTDVKTSEDIPPETEKDETWRIGMLIATTSKNSSMKIDELPFFQLFLPSFLQSINKTDKHEYIIYLGYDKGDPLFDNQDNKKEIIMKIAQTVSGYKVKLRYMGFENQTQSPCFVWNKLYEVSYQDKCQYFYQLGDDIIFMTPNWLKSFVKKLQDSPAGEDIGVVGPIDVNIRTEPKLTQAFVSRKHFEIFGYLYPPTFKNWYSDNWITMVYQKYHTVYCPEIFIRNGSGVGQERYEIDNSAKDILEDEVKKGEEQIHRYLTQK